MTRLRKCYGQRRYTRENAYKTVCPILTAIKSHLRFYGENPKIIGLFSEFGRIAYVTMRKIIREQIKDKTLKAIIVGYAENHICDMYKIYNPNTNRFIMIRDIKYNDRKETYPSETMKMFLTMDKQYIVPGIEEVIGQNKTPTSKPKTPLRFHIINDEGVSDRHNGNDIKKASVTNKSTYERIQQALEK